MLSNAKGTIICFSGIDGSGKTAHALKLYKKLKKKEYKCAYLRPRYAVVKLLPSFLEKRFEKLPNFSRKKRFSTENHRLSALKFFRICFYLAYGFFTHYFILKLFYGKTIVICDRYYYDWFHDLKIELSIDFASLLPNPDLVFLLDVPIKIAYSRMRYSQDCEINPEYYRSLRNWYLDIAKKWNFIIINSSLDLESNQDIILNYVLTFLKGN